MHLIDVKDARELMRLLSAQELAHARMLPVHLAFHAILETALKIHRLDELAAL